MPDPISPPDQESIPSLLFQGSYEMALAENEQDILSAITATLRRTGFLSGLLMVEYENIFFVSFYDPQIGEIPLHEKDNFPSHDVTALFKNSEPIFVTEPSTVSKTLSDLVTPFFNLNARSVALIPADISGQFFGLVIIGSRLSQQLTRDRLKPIINLVEMMCQSIFRLRTIQKTQTRLDGLHHSLDIALNVLFETDLEPLYKIIHSQVKQILGKVDFLIAIYNSEKQVIELPYAFEKDVRIYIDPFPLGEGLTSILIKNRQPIIFVTDAENQAKALGAKIIGLPAKSWMGVPLLVGDVVIGAMIAEDVEHEHRFTEDDLDFFKTLAPTIAASIRNAQMVTEIQKTLKAYDEEKYLLSVLMDTITDKVYFKDRDSRFIRANRAMLELFHLEKLSDLVGKSDFDFFSNEHASQAFNDEQEIIRTGKAVVDKVEKETWQGRKNTWAISTKAPLFDPQGNIIGTLGISRDVTELVEVRETAQRRARQLLTAAEIARDVSSALQPEELLSRVVSLVRDRFGFYHAAVFLVDEAHEYAVLRESTGEAGRQMKKAGHKLPIGSKSIVGQVTANGKPLVINDVSKDPTHLPNPLLPATRSELAIPLKISDRILGALDVQHTQANAFSPDDVTILQTLADQLSTAIANSELFSETQKALTQHRMLHQITNAASSATNLEDGLFSVTQGLHVIMEGTQVAILMANTTTGELEVKAWGGYPSDVNISSLRIAPGEGLTGAAARDRQTIYSPETSKDSRYMQIDRQIHAELAIPLIFHDEVLGVLNLESATPYAFTESDQGLLETLAVSVAVVIANTRLVEQIRRQVERQRQLFEAADRIRRSVDIKTVLETSAIEIARTIGAVRARIEIIPANTDAKSTPTVSGGNGRKASQ